MIPVAIPIVLNRGRRGVPRIKSTNGRSRDSRQGRGCTLRSSSHYSALNRFALVHNAVHNFCHRVHGRGDKSENTEQEPDRSVAAHGLNVPGGASQYQRHRAPFGQCPPRYQCGIRCAIRKMENSGSAQIPRTTSNTELAVAPSRAHWPSTGSGSPARSASAPASSQAGPK